jgi:beta-1,4-N-acetylglucosaminyltransferase
MKIALVCSHGGHLTETLYLLPALEGHDFFFVTSHGPRDFEILSNYQAYFLQNIGTNPWRMFLAYIWAPSVLLAERPDAVVSLGAEIAIPFLCWARLLGIRTLFIESWCRVENFSLTGRLVYPVVDAFWVQWPQLLKKGGAKVSFHGAIA